MSRKYFYIFYSQLLCLIKSFYQSKLMESIRLDRQAPLTPPEDMTFSKLLEYWEKRFWLSEFSHLGKQPGLGNGKGTRQSV